jgi:hypothetical protein
MTKYDPKGWILNTQVLYNIFLPVFWDHKREQRTRTFFLLETNYSWENKTVNNFITN